MPDNTPIIQAYLAQNPYKAPQKKKQTGKGGTLTSLISEGGALGGGAAGAAAGTAILPGIGTLVGGAIGAGVGAFTGRVAENKVRDNRLGIGDAAKEGLVTGLLSAPGKGLKVGYNATKTLAKGGALEDALLAANTAASKTGIVGGAANKIRTSAGDRSAQGYGVKTSKKLLPDDADAVTDFIKNRASNYGGIKPGAPVNQARDAQGVVNGVVKQLDNSLNSINRPLKPEEVKKITASLDNRLINDPDITGNTELANKFKTLIANKDIKGLEKLRRSYDDIGFKANGDPATTAKAAEALAIRDAIDEFVTPLSKDYKAIKGDYGLAKKALELTSVEGGKAPKGIGLPFVNGGITGNGIGGNVVAGARNKFNAKVAGSGATGAVNPTLSAGKTGARMGAQGSLADALINGQGSMNADMTDSTTDPTTIQANTSNMSQDYQNTDDLSSAADQNPYPRENLIADIQRDPANADDYIKLYQQYQEVFAAPASEKPLSAESSKVVSNANIGLQALQDFQSAVQQDPSILAKRILPGRGLLGGAVGGALGTRGADAAANQIVDVIARLRTGAAITADEAKRFETFIPQAGDSPAVQNQKLNYLATQFQAVASRTGGSSNNLEDALMTQQGAY